MQLQNLKKILGRAALPVALTALTALTALVSAPALAATFSAVPSAPLATGGTVVIDFRIDDIADLYAYQYSFRFDPTVLQVTGYGNGGFLESDGNGLIAGGLLDNIAGMVSFTYGARIGAVPGVTGSGTLARYMFNVVGAGSSTLDFTDVVFLDSGLNDIAVQYGPQVLAAVPEPSACLSFGAGLTMLAALRRRQRGRVAVQV